MAIYYLNVQIIGRSAGRSATAAAAYRAGERIVDERTGRVFDYTERQGEIETEIHAPAGAPEWVQDRSRLWNEVERAERRGDAQVAREMVVAFPKELSPDQQRELIRSYVQEQFVSLGMVADVAIHRNQGNPHAHIMLTMREIGPEGFSAKKNREWNKPEMLERWRAEWAGEANRALERAGSQKRIDHRSLAEQGSDRLPQVHLGPHSAALERQGVATERGEHNRLVAEHNAVVVDLDKAREEKRQLEVDQAVTDRYKTRLRVGWHPAHAEALGRLEYASGGVELTRTDVSNLLDSRRQEVRGLEQQIASNHQEELRLERAETMLASRSKAAAMVDRLKSPVAVVKRWFNEGARKEFQQAQQRLQGFDEALQRIGTTSETQFQEQRLRWQQAQAKVPALEAKVENLTPGIKLASQALAGFAHQLKRAAHERTRARDREFGRGR